MQGSYDIKRERRDLYAPAADAFDVVQVPPLQLLMADGHGDPNTSPDYTAVVQALYTVSYAVRAICKAELERVHTVGPLEGLWSAADLGAFRRREKSAWDWTLMIVQPGWVTHAIVDEALERARARKALSALDALRLESLDEGLSVQVLHVGPYDDEGPTIARMHEEFMPANGFVPRGRHHEIYLSDPRRTDPSRLRTILRQPVVRGVHDDGPFYHGTKADLAPGDVLQPGHSSNYGARRRAGYVYVTATLDAATWGAELAVGEGAGRIYRVAPTGPLEDDPNLTDTRFPGNPTRSYRTRDPVRVVGEVRDWVGHPPGALQQMRDHLEELERLGIEAIDE